MIRYLNLAGLSLLPIYLWGSGGVQLSHLAFAAAIALFLVQFNIRLIGAESLLLALAFVVAMRESFSVLEGESPLALMNILYIIFSIGVFNLFRRWLPRNGSLRLSSRGMLFAVAIAVAGVMIKGYGLTVDAEGERAIGTFNNPNQLGYFAVCIFSISGLLYLGRAISPRIMLIMVAGSIFLAVASLSKAAMIGVAFGALFIGYASSESKRRFVIGSLIGGAVVAGSMILYQSGYLDNLQFVQRLIAIGGDSDDSIAGRGYDAVFEMGATELLIGFGAEGAKSIIGHEVHSTFASFFINYGVVGGSLFLAFHLAWARRLWRQGGLTTLAVVAAPAMLYGLTHNGSRFTIYWVLLAMSFAFPVATLRVPRPVAGSRG